MLHQWSSTNEAIEVRSFSSGEEIIDRYSAEQESYDVIFVDIELGKMNGLEAMRKLRAAGMESEIVITTNHQDMSYIQESFSLSALQYYVKPVVLENIAECMKKTNEKKHIVFECNGARQIVPIKEILYFESNRNYIVTHCLSSTENPNSIRSTLTQFVSMLPNSFVQVHRSFAVNISHVVKIKERTMYLRSGVSLPIGKLYLENTLRVFQKQK